MDDDELRHALHRATGSLVLDPPGAATDVRREGDRRRARRHTVHAVVVVGLVALLAGVGLDAWRTPVSTAVPPATGGASGGRIGPQLVVVALLAGLVMLLVASALRTRALGSQTSRWTLVGSWLVLVLVAVTVVNRAASLVGFHGLVSWSLVVFDVVPLLTGVGACLLIGTRVRGQVLAITAFVLLMLAGPPLLVLDLAPWWTMSRSTLVLVVLMAAVVASLLLLVRGGIAVGAIEGRVQMRGRRLGAFVVLMVVALGCANLVLHSWTGLPVVYQAARALFTLAVGLTLGLAWAARARRDVRSVVLGAALSSGVSVVWWLTMPHREPWVGLVQLALAAAVPLGAALVGWIAVPEDAADAGDPDGAGEAAT